MNNTTDFQDNSTSVIPQDIPYKEEIDKHLYNCDLFKLYVDGILNTVIITFGFVSNIFTVITLWDERQKNGTSFLLICLALADNFVLLNGSVNTVIFRWFKFTLKPPNRITGDKLRLAIWDTSFWTFWLKFGHKRP